MAIPQATVQNTLLAASLKIATMVLANDTAMQNGNQSVKWGTIKRAQRGVNAVQRQYNLQDYSSKQFLTAYNCLQNFVGSYGPGTLNPNAQNPGTVIEVINSSDFTTSSAFFFDGTTIQILNYAAALYPTYGKYPIITIYTGDNTNGFQLDSQTDPIPTYPGNDATQVPLFFTWTYLTETKGFYTISGLKP